MKHDRLWSQWCMDSVLQDEMKEVDIKETFYENFSEKDMEMDPGEPPETFVKEVRSYQEKNDEIDSNRLASPRVSCPIKKQNLILREFGADKEKGMVETEEVTKKLMDDNLSSVKHGEETDFEAFETFVKGSCDSNENDPLQDSNRLDEERRVNSSGLKNSEMSLRKSESGEEGKDEMRGDKKFLISRNEEKIWEDFNQIYHLEKCEEFLDSDEKDIESEKKRTSDIENEDQQDERLGINIQREGGNGKNYIMSLTLVEGFEKLRKNVDQSEQESRKECEINEKLVLREREDNQSGGRKDKKNEENSRRRKTEKHLRRRNGDGKSDWEIRNMVQRMNMLNSQKSQSHVEKAACEKETSHSDESMGEKDDSYTEKGQKPPIINAKNSNGWKSNDVMQKCVKKAGKRNKKKTICEISNKNRCLPLNLSCPSPVSYNKRSAAIEKTRKTSDGMAASVKRRENKSRTVKGMKVRIKGMRRSRKRQRRFYRNQRHTPRPYRKPDRKFRGKKRRNHGTKLPQRIENVPLSDKDGQDGLHHLGGDFRVRHCPSDGYSGPSRAPSNTGGNVNGDRGSHSNDEHNNERQNQYGRNHSEDKMKGHDRRGEGATGRAGATERAAATGREVPGGGEGPGGGPIGIHGVSPVQPGSRCGEGARVKIKGPPDKGEGHSCFREEQIDQKMQLLKQIDKLATHTKNAFEEFNKCIVKCLGGSGDVECHSCSVLTLALKHVGKSEHSHWTHCETEHCKMIANLLYYHTRSCLQSGTGTSNPTCTLKICLNLRDRVRQACSTSIEPIAGLQQLWRNPVVWVRIKTYLHRWNNLPLGIVPVDDSVGFTSVSLYPSSRASLGFPIPPFPDPSPQSISNSFRLRLPSQPPSVRSGGQYEQDEPDSPDSGSTDSVGVMYGSKEALIAKAKEWMEIKNAKQSGEGTANEQGVILHSYKKKLRIRPQGLYRRGYEWDTATPLGAGMFGHCYMAFDSESYEYFCLKEVPLYKFEISEVELLSELSHPYICAIYGALLHNSSVYILLEFVQGCSLKEHIEAHGHLNGLTAMIFFKKLIEVLIFLRENQIIHEDIKTENILLRSGTADLVLVDFGLARQFGPDMPQVGENEPPVGAQTQWSPEKAMSKGYVYEADIWAATCVLNEMLSGFPPWIQRFSDSRQLHYVIAMRSPPVEDIAEHTPADIRELITLLWTLDVRERPSCISILHHRAFHIDEERIKRMITTQSILPSGVPSPTTTVVHHPSTTSNPNHNWQEPNDTPPEILSGSPKSVLEGVWKALSLSEKRAENENLMYGSSSGSLDEGVSLGPPEGQPSPTRTQITDVDTMPTPGVEQPVVVIPNLPIFNGSDQNAVNNDREDAISTTEPILGASGPPAQAPPLVRHSTSTDQMVDDEYKRLMEEFYREHPEHLLNDDLAEEDH